MEKNNRPCFFRMNCLQLVRSWDIPQNVTKCSCWVIPNQKKITLHPGVINEIVIPFEGDAPTTLLQVNNHMCDKPWRIISEYIYFNQRTHSLTIPVITTFLRTLAVDEPICHVELMDPLHTLRALKGKIF